MHWAGEKVCSHLSWTSQLHSGAFAEAVKDETTFIQHLEEVFKNVHWRRDISDNSNFIKALAWCFTLIVVVHRSVADEVVRTVTKIHP